MKLLAASLSLLGTSAFNSGAQEDFAASFVHRRGCRSRSPPSDDNFVYLDNGVVRLGIDKSRGGAIGFLSASGSTRNVLNHHDFGRLVQGSFYSGPDPFDTPTHECTGSSWDPWPWNPIGGGDAFNHSSTLLNVTISPDSTSAVIVSRPFQWACDNVPCQCTFTQRVSLVASAVEVTLQLANARTDISVDQLYSFTQELPAVYVIGAFCHLFTVNASTAFTTPPNPPTEVPATWPWSNYKPSEGWLAFANSSDPDTASAVGVWGPFHTNTGAGRFFSSPPVACGGEAGDDPTGYIAPWVPEILDASIEYAYNFSLILGSLAEIQAYAAAKHSAGEDTPPTPDYVFSPATGRAHCTFSGGLVDGGWPVPPDGLLIPLTPNATTGGLVVGPWGSWSAADVPAVYVNGSWPEGAGALGVAWMGWGEGAPCATCEVAQAIPPGTPGFQVVRVDLSASGAYTGRIGRIALRPALTSVPGGSAQIASITSTPPSGRA